MKRLEETDDDAIIENYRDFFKSSNLPAFEPIVFDDDNNKIFLEEMKKRGVIDNLALMA